jgi:hypothetical protein
MFATRGSFSLLTGLTAALVAAFAVSAASASAHTTGLSWVATSSPYVIDIGYDPSEFQAGLSARFDFLLQDEKTSDSVAFDHVWVRLLHNNVTVLATGVRRQELGPTTLLYRLMESGIYTLEASFRDSEGSDLAVGSFPVTILADPESKGPVLSSLLLFVAGLCVGAVALFLWGRRRK